jgi:hypothetical protein
VLDYPQLIDQQLFNSCTPFFEKRADPTQSNELREDAKMMQFGISGYPRRRAVLALLFGINLSLSCGFVVLQSPSRIVTNQSPIIRTELYAKKQQRKKTTTTSSSGVSGFGSSTSGGSSLQGRVRSISSTGQAGSGTKPLRQAANNFDALRKEYGKECCHDLYCKSPLNDPELLWFVGKIAVRPNTAATPQQAVLSQKRIILEYSKTKLRPQNFGGKYASTLELWLAPGDSEMDVVQNKLALEKVKGSATDLSEDFSIVDVGYNPEIYLGDEVAQGGLRIKRDENGEPVKAPFEINESM